MNDPLSLIFISTLLSNNFVLAMFLGLCPFLQEGDIGMDVSFHRLDAAENGIQYPGGVHLPAFDLILQLMNG